jgi:hypothetical protein
MAKKKIVYQENYKKGVTASKDVLIEYMNNPNTTVELTKAGRYEDGAEFITITIGNIRI